jgi:hypothetical protein
MSRGSVWNFTVIDDVSACFSLFCHHLSNCRVNSFSQFLVVDVLAFLLRVHNTYQIVWPWQTARVRCEKSVIAVHHGSVARLVAPCPSTFLGHFHTAAYREMSGIQEDAAQPAGNTFP